MTRLSARALLSAALLGTTMLASGGVATRAHAETGEEREYNITAATLAEALSQLADQSEAQISYEADLVANQHSGELHGRFTEAEALSRLLSGKGLVARRVGPDSLTILKATTGSMTLDEVEIKGSVQSASVEQRAELARHHQGGSPDTIIVLGQHLAANQTPTSGPWGAKAILDTPYSINVMSRDMIENVVAGDMDQIYKMNPVVQNSAPSTVYGTPYANIRGFSTQSGIMDGLRLSSTSTGIAMEELESVEIMNGLTGFMYGVGNPGGVTNYVLKRPTYHQIADVTAGNYGGNQFFGHIDLGNRIDKDGILAYRLNLSHQDGGTSKDGQNVRRTLFSGALDINASPDIRLQLEAARLFYRIDGIDSRFYAYSDSSFGALNYWIAPLDNSKTYTPSWTYLQIKTDRVGANAKWRINDSFSLRAAYLYKRDEQESINIYPAYFANSGFQNGWPSRSAPSVNTAQGAYAYLDSEFETFGIQHRLTLGASGDWLRVTNHVVSSVSASNSPAYADPADLMTWARPTAFDNPNWGGTYTPSDSNNYNIIVGDDIQFTEKFSALVGLNRTHIKTNSYTTAGVRSAFYSKTAVTPTVSLIFKPAHRLTTYVSYMQGLEKGTVISNDAQNAEPGKILDPFISKQYETGVKYAPTEALLITGALYRIEKANSYQEVNSAGKFVINQDGLEIHQGVEFTASGKVTRNLTLVVGGTWMDLSIEKATSAALQGKQPTGVANKLAKIFADYRIPGLADLSVSGGAFYSGDMYKDSANLQKIDGFVVFDLGVHYKTEIAQHPVKFDLNVANLTNKSYWASSYSLGIPRNIAFSVKFGF